MVSKQNDKNGAALSEEFSSSAPDSAPANVPVRKFIQQEQKPYGDRSPEEIEIIKYQQRIGGGCDL